MLLLSQLPFLTFHVIRNKEAKLTSDGLNALNIDEAVNPIMPEKGLVLYLALHRTPECLYNK